MLAPCWEQTDQVVTHTLIRPLVALLYEFAKEASSIMAPVFPALEKIREIPIKVTRLLTRFALWKGSGS
jgi:hypothetical protein